MHLRAPRRPAGFLLAVASAALAGSVCALPGDAATLIVLNKAEASASLIDADSGREVARVATGPGPHEVAVSPDGRLAVVADYGVRGEAGNTLTVIDVVAARVLKSIELEAGARPHGLVFLRDGRRLLVTAEGLQALLLVDVEAGRVLRSFATEQAISHMLAVTPDESRAFVANIGSGTVTAFDLQSGQRLDHIVTGEGAEGIAVTPDGAHLWVTNRASDTVSVLDTASLEIVDTLPCASFPIRAQVTPDGRWVLVSCARSGDLAVFDARQRREVRRVPLKIEASETEGRLFGSTFGDSSVPIGILPQPNGRRAYVAHANADLVSIIDLETWKVSGHVRGGREPDGLGWSHLDVAPKDAPKTEEPR